MKDLLKFLDIKYASVTHKPVYTSKEAEFIKEKINGIGCKNLFLKDNFGKYYLYIFEDTKKANIKALEKFLGVKKLHFGSSEELENILKLIPGGVTPLGIINDSKTQVTIIIDNGLVNQKILMHMDTNTITVSIDYSDLIKYITYLKHEYKIFKGDNNE